MAQEPAALYWLKNAAYLPGMPAYAALMLALTPRTKTDKERFAIARQVRFRGYSLRPYQVEEEILGLLDELHAKGAKNIVEIGTARGGTLFLFLRSLPPDGRVVSVDLHRGAFGGGYQHWKIPLFHAASLGGPGLTLLRGNSQTEAMRDRVRAALGAPADFILIDGDHSYEGARRDFELYRPLVKPGGLIAFHDIVPGNSRSVGGVPRLWVELKGQFPSRELVRDWGQGGYGIGLLTV
jgi:predicted O-methyltransferase YrrM